MKSNKRLPLAQVLNSISSYHTIFLLSIYHFKIFTHGGKTCAWQPNCCEDTRELCFLLKAYRYAVLTEKKKKRCVEQSKEEIVSDVSIM